MANKRRFWQRIDLPVSERRMLMAIGDLIAVNAAVLISLRVWSLVGDRVFNWEFILQQLAWFVILSMLWLLIAASNDYYNLHLSANWTLSQRRLVVINIQLLLVYLVIFFFSPRAALPRLFILYYAVSSYVLIALWRMARPFLRGWKPLLRRVLIVGTGLSADTMVSAIKNAAPEDYLIVGFVQESPAGKGGTEVPSIEIVGTSRQLPELVKEHHIHEVILATQDDIDGELFQSIMDCYEQGVRLIPMPLLYEQLTNMVPVEYVGGLWNLVIPLEGRSPFDPYPIVKRFIDITISLFGLAVFCFLLPLIAVLILVDSWGPIFLRQERVGKAGKVFCIYKLRTMIPNAEKQSGPIWAIQGDPRITRVGRFFRRSRIDELPQLLNILKGEMSLIGPRPERPFFVSHLQNSIPYYRARLAIRPGVTGWAQVNYGYGSSDTDQLNKLKYDLYYIRHRSLLLDFLILLRTAGKVIQLQGQ